MKKFYLLLTALILVSALSPAYGQWRKKKAKATETPKQKIEVIDTAGNPVVIEVEDPQTPVTTPAFKGKNANMTLADVIARLEKMEKSVKMIQTDVGKVKKEVKRAGQSTLDSMLSLRNGLKESSSKLGLTLSILSEKMKTELASNAEFMIKLKEQADSGDAEAAQAYVDLEKLKDQSRSQKWIAWALVFGIFSLLIFVLLLWWQKRKMGATLEQIQAEKDPDPLSFRGSSKNAYGDRVGSTGSEHAENAMA